MNQHSTTTNFARTPGEITVGDILGQATRSVDSLLAKLDRSTGPNDDNVVETAELQRIIESLPLSTDEFGLAMNRLRNASRYLRSHERGAARYELKMLARSLDRDRHQVNRPSPKLSQHAFRNRVFVPNASRE